MKDSKNISINISPKSILVFFSLLGALFLVFLIKDIIAIFLISAIIFIGLNPLVNKLATYKIPRSVSVISLYLMFFGLIGFMFYLITPQVLSQVKDMSESLPDFVSNLHENFDFVPEYNEFSVGLKDSLDDFANNFSSYIGDIFSVATRFFGILASFVLILVLVLYMTVAGDEIETFLKSIFPKSKSEKVAKKIKMIQVKIGSWLRGQFILMLVVGFLSFIGLTMLGVDYALTLAVLAGILEIIPFFGPVISAIPAIFIGFTQSPTLALLVLALYVGIQQLENHLLVPKVMQRTTGLSPVVVLLAILIGGKLLGFLGIVLAVPAALVVSVFLEEVIEKNQGR